MIKEITLLQTLVSEYASSLEFNTEEEEHVYKNYQKNFLEKSPNKREFGNRQEMIWEHVIKK